MVITSVRRTLQRVRTHTKRRQDACVCTVVIQQNHFDCIRHMQSTAYAPARTHMHSLSCQRPRPVAQFSDEVDLCLSSAHISHKTLRHFREKTNFLCIQHTDCWRARARLKSATTGQREQKSNTHGKLVRAHIVVLFVLTHVDTCTFATHTFARAKYVCARSLVE